MVSGVRIGPSNKVLLIVVELGAGWPSWLDKEIGASPRRVACQREGETPSAFAARLVEELGDGAPGVRSAVLLCNERVDAEQTEARRRIASRLVEMGASHVWFGAAGSERLENALRALSDEPPLSGRALIRSGAEGTPPTSVARVA